MTAATGVCVLGTGRAAAELVRACRERPDVALVAGVTQSASKHGRDLGALTVGEPIGVPVTTDLDAVLARPDVGVVLHAGLGPAADVPELLGRCVDAGTDAITVSGLVHPERALGSAAAEALDRRARAGGGRIVGTGVNPGFLLDTLPATAATMVARVDRVYARRVSEVRHWSAGVLDTELGIGRPPEEVDAGDGPALDQSVALVSDALRLDVDRIDDVVAPLVAPATRRHAGRVVERGRTMGFRRRSRGLRDGAVVVELEWVAIFCIDPAVDGVEESASLVVEGDSRFELAAAGTFCGDAYPGTVARAINAIRPLARMRPGLYRPDQLPPA